ncbi:hypothetical protein BYT27DRAFT_7287047 [Phlegmacium glaucopus]|nr:hypothetical protein BYT27DRAFT_7287047 [Phlegmacium glaucopus]
MGPGSRRDTLDDHFGDYNWNKITKMAETFIRKSEEAIVKRQEHVEAFIEFNAALPTSATKAWTKLCQTWERDRSQANPFLDSRKVISEADVRLRLAEEDADRIVSGSQLALHSDISASMLIYQGLELEDLQRRHVRDAAELGPHSTSLQQAKIVEGSNSLRRKIEAWIEIQHLYIPAIAPLRARVDFEGGGKPPAVQEIKLYLPSTLIGTIVCEHHFLTIEWRLCYAQAEATLGDIRNLLLLRSLMFKSKDRYSRGQRQQTRSLALIARVEGQLKALAGKYRKIWKALKVLSTPLVNTSWCNVLRELEDADLDGMTLDDSGSKGRKKLSWIWKHFVLSGAELVLGPIVGRRNAFYFMKKCSASWPFLPGNTNAGG